MMIDLLRSRRSIRTFTDQPLARETVNLLLEAALRAPSSRGKAPCEFVAVSNAETIARLASARPHGSAFLKGAPLVIIVCASPQTSDVWIEDAALAALTLHLQAHDLGLGSCWVQVRLRDHDAHRSAGEYIAEVIGLDPALAVEAMVAIGYPAEAKPGHPSSSLPSGKISFEAYGRR